MDDFDHEGPIEGFWQYRVPEGASCSGSCFFERVEYQLSHEPSSEELRRYARTYFELDDELGNFLLGDCYRHGRGVPQSYDKAIWWFLRDADNSKNQKRRLQACFAFYQSGLGDLDRAYDIEKGRALLFEPYIGLEMWRNLTSSQLAEGLLRLTEYEREVDVTRTQWSCEQEWLVETGDDPVQLVFSFLEAVQRD